MNSMEDITRRGSASIRKTYIEPVQNKKDSPKDSEGMYFEGSFYDFIHRRSEHNKQLIMNASKGEEGNFEGKDNLSNLRGYPVIGKNPKIEKGNETGNPHLSFFCPRFWHDRKTRILFEALNETNFAEVEEIDIENDFDELTKKGKLLFYETIKQVNRGSAFSAQIHALNLLKNKKFTDTDFPPTLKSLVGENKTDRRAWTTLKWFRASDFMNTPYVEIFSKEFSDYEVAREIEPSDIKQGGLGDCYFLASVAALSLQPIRIRKLFSNEFDPLLNSVKAIESIGNLYGCFFVNICEKGVWKQVIVDDFFPCYNISQGPAFTKSNGKELWVILLEKAWAKLHGSYDKIENGVARECLHDLTGAPTETHRLDLSNIWELLMMFTKKEYSMTTGSKTVSKQSGESDLFSDVGIIPRHAYTFYGAYEVKFKNKITQLVKLRNPWGYAEWNGPWSDHSNQWDSIDQEIKKNLMFQRKPDDGIFFMDFQNFQYFFDDINVCYVQDNFEYCWLKTSTTWKKGVYFSIQISKPGLYYFIINITSKRHLPYKFSQSFQYTNVTLVMSKRVNFKGQYKYIASTQKADREVWISEHLEEGEYILHVKLPWRYSQREDFVLSSYGVSKIYMVEISKNEVPLMLENTFLNYAKNLCPSKFKKNFTEKGHPNSFVSVYCLKYGFGYLAAWNDSNKTMKASFKLKSLTPTIKIRKPNKMPLVNFLLKPGEEAIALVKNKDDNSKALINYTLSVKFYEN